MLPLRNLLAFLLIGSAASAQSARPAPTGGPAGPTRPAPPGIGTRRVAAGLADPVLATHAPGDTSRLFIVEQVQASIRILHLDTLVLDPVAFLDIDSRVTSLGGEQGLLGLAFHPEYQTNGLFYVNYSRNVDGDTVIAEYQVTANPDVADFGSERILLTIDQPQPNHNGGWLGFSPLDGYLYIATGDGGNACDSGPGHTASIGNAQDLTNNLLGKILRIDPLGGSPYASPAGNPFVGITGDDQIWAYGLRNPWRASFDRATGDLYIGDVGQDLREEVDFQDGLSAGGENYGWRCQEGNGCSATAPSSCPATTGCNCPGGTPGLVPPVHDYRHLSPPAPAFFVCAVTGGYVYRGDELPQIYGHYFLADFCGDAIWSFRVVNGVKTDYQDRTSDLNPSLDGHAINSISSFGEDAEGNLYIVDLGGEIFRIVPEH